MDWGKYLQKLYTNTHLNTSMVQNTLMVQFCTIEATVAKLLTVLDNPLNQGRRH